MMNPNVYFRDLWTEAETTAAKARSSGGKSETRLQHGRHRFTYTIERLQSGCLVYQLTLVEQNRGTEEA